MTIIHDIEHLPRPRSPIRGPRACAAAQASHRPATGPGRSRPADLQRIEQALADAVAAGEGPGGPPLLAAAIRHAVFPGGARIRPRLCLAVSQACGDGDPRLADAAAAAIELLHCASLVHDDLPCFDDAPLRRGVPSIHSRFGERIAVLTGDALIVLSFQIVAAAATAAPQRLGPLLAAIARGVGTPTGIVAGQACECEPYVALAAYLVRVIYDHHDARALAILRAAHAALPPGGTLLVAEPMAAADGAPRMGDAYFGIYLLAMGSGRARTAAQLSALLHEAGFVQVRERPTPIPLQVGVIVARKPGRASA